MWGGSERPEANALTGYIQPGVARGHAGHVDGREGVPPGVGLHHPLYQQALAAGAVLVETADSKRQTVRGLSEKQNQQPQYRWTVKCQRFKR